jgi:hypothetical protein
MRIGCFSFAVFLWVLLFAWLAFGLNGVVFVTIVGLILLPGL